MSVMFEMGRECLFVTASLLQHRRQINARYVVPLVAQPLGNSEPGLIFRVAMLQKGLIPFRRAGVAKSVESQGAVGIRVADFLTVDGDKVLQFRNGNMDLPTLRDEQFLACRSMVQSVFQCSPCGLAKWNLPYLAAK